MIIGIAAPHLLSARKHGMDVVLAETLRALAALPSTHQYVVFARPGPDLAAMPVAPHMRLVTVWAPEAVSWTQVALPRAARRAGCGLLHATGNTAPLHAGMPTLLTLHDADGLDRRRRSRTPLSTAERLRRTYRRVVTRATAMSARRVVTVSEFERARITEVLPELATRLRVMPNAVAQHFLEAPDADTVARVRATLGLPLRFVLSMGNTDPRQNLDGVLAAWLRLEQRGIARPPLVLLAVGRETLDAALERVGAPASLADSIRLVGFVAQQDLGAVYRMASLFLYPSRTPSSGLPVLEAMASGVPVITSRTAAMPEVAGDAALCVEASDADAIAEAVARVLGDEALRLSLRYAGPIRARSFSWHRVAKAWLRLHASVAAEVTYAAQREPIPVRVRSV